MVRRLNVTALGKTARGGGPGGPLNPDLNGLLAEPRRMKILDWLQEEGSARVRDLSAAFGVSEATIRQDLEKLESDGHINRQHGGAFLRTMPKQVETLSLQHMENIEKKRKIGIKAASSRWRRRDDHPGCRIDDDRNRSQSARSQRSHGHHHRAQHRSDAGSGAGIRSPYARRSVQGADFVLERGQGGGLFPGRARREAFPRDGGRRLGLGAHPSQFRRLAAQAGDDPGRFARLSCRRTRPRSTVRPLRAWERSTSFIPLSPTTAFTTKTFAPLSAAGSRSLLRVEARLEPLKWKCFVARPPLGNAINRKQAKEDHLRLRLPEHAQRDAAAARTRRLSRRNNGLLPNRPAGRDRPAPY